MAGKREKKSKGEEPEAAKPEGAEGAEGEASAKKKLSGKTLVLFIILPALLVVGGGGAAAMMLMGGKKEEAVAEAGEHGEAGEASDAHGEAKSDKKDAKKDAKKKDEHAAPAAGGHGEAGEGGETELGVLTIGHDGDPSYYTLPKMIVNLAGHEGERPLVMQLELVLEASDPGIFDEMPARMPRLNDQFQTFLRELRVEDLNGSAGSYRLRLELMRRFNLVMAPAKVDAVLIEGILIN
jgi:flagellar FliL protein